MSIDLLMNIPVTVLTRVAGVEDPLIPGEIEDTFSTGATTSAYLEQTVSREILSGRDTVISNWLVVLPIGVVIEAYDRLDTPYGTLEVVGDPAVPIVPRSGEHHIEVRARIVEG